MKISRFLATSTLAALATRLGSVPAQAGFVFQTFDNPTDLTFNQLLGSGADRRILYGRRRQCEWPPGQQRSGAETGKGVLGLALLILALATRRFEGLRLRP